MKNMKDFWHYPEIKEDKAEYKRMRREWKKLQRQEDNSSSKSNDFKKSSKAKLVVCLCSIFIFACWVFNNYDDLKLNSFSKNESIISEFGSFFNVGKKVSYLTNCYIEQSKMCTLKWIDLSVVINDSYKDFNTYSDELDLLLKEIDLLNEKSISQYDELKSYEVVCETYYGCIYSFFVSVKEQQFIPVDAYNRFLIELNSLESPYNHLIKLFDEHGYYYYVGPDKTVHYKANNSLF